MSQLILGIGHKSRNGKDSFLQAVDQHYAIQSAAAARHGVIGYKHVTIQRLSFADPLYKEVNDFLVSPRGLDWREGHLGVVIEPGVVIADWVTPDKPAEDPRAPHGKYAKLLQWWGTEYRRAQNPNYWTDKWKASINPKASIVASTDMRFLNEAKTIREVGGYTFDIRRLNPDGTPYIDPSRDANHQSEIELDNANHDFYIKVKTGDLALLGEIAITYVHYLRALKGN